MSTRDLIKDAIKLAGSETKLAELTGYSQHAIWKAKILGRVSPEMAMKIENALKGAISKSRLRPDLWPPPTKSRERAGAA